MDCPTTSVTELQLLDFRDMLVAGTEATVVTETASLSLTEEKMSLDSKPDNLSERPGDVAETGYSSIAAGRVSNMRMEGGVTVESEMTEGLGVVDLEAGTVGEVGGSVDAVVPAGFAEMLAAGNSVPLALASGIEALALRSVSVVDAVAAVVA